MNTNKYEYLKLGYDDAPSVFPFTLCVSDVIYDLMGRDIDGLFFLGNDVLTEYDEYGNSFVVVDRTKLEV